MSATALIQQLRDAGGSLEHGAALVDHMRSKAWRAEAATAASEVLRDVLEFYDEAQDKPATQHWIVAFLATFVAELAPHLSCEELSYLALLTSMLLNQPPAPHMLPAIIDLVAALYIHATKRILTASDDPGADSLFTELEGLRKALRALVVVPAGGASLPAVHVANAMRDIVVAFAGPKAVDISSSDGAAAPAVDAEALESVTGLEAPEGHSVVSAAVAADVIADCVATLSAPFNTSGVGPRACIAAVNAFDAIVRMAPGAWKVAIPELCNVAQLAAKRGEASAVGMRSTSFVEVYLAACATVRRIEEASAFHRMAVGAYTALGAQRDMAAHSKAAPRKPAKALPAKYAMDVSIPRGAADAQEAAEAAAGPAPETDEPTHTTTAGTFTLHEMAAIIIDSLKRMDEESASNIDRAHYNGLKQMQLTAALNAQQAELDRRRAQAARGVDGIPIGRILSSLPCSYDAVERGQTTLRNGRLKASYVRAAFDSALATYESLAPGASSAPAAGRVLRAQALVSQLLGKVPVHTVDICVDRLCESVLKDLPGSATAASTSLIANPNYELVVQCLYALYAQLAPSGEQTFSFGGGDDTTFGGDSSAAIKIDPTDPIRWMTDPEADAAARKAQSRSKRNRREEEPFTFGEELSDVPTTGYSHLLCRVMHAVLAQSAALRTLLDDCPAITVPAWIVLHRTLCMSEQTSAAQIGLSLLATLMRTRPPVAQKCLSLMLFYSTCGRRATRVYAVKELRELMRSPTTPRPVKDAILESAKRSLAKVATLRVAKTEAPPAGMTVQQMIQQKLEHVVLKHMNLYIVLCANDVALLGDLLTTYKECGEAGGAFAKALQQVLLTSADIQKLLASLGKSQDALAILKAYPPGSEAFVVAALTVFARQVQRDALADSNKRERRVHLEVVKSLVATCESLHRESNDVRFLVPVLSFMPRAALKAQYVPALMPLFGDIEKNAIDVEGAVKSIIRNCGIEFDDGERGMSPSELLVFLHTLPLSDGVTPQMVAQATQWMLTQLKKRVGEQIVPVMGVPETTHALHQLVTQKPVPTLLMRTAIIAVQQEPQLQRFVLNSVVKELIKQTVWRTSPELWHGVVLFIERNWPATLEALLSLPDATLVETLRGNERLHSLLAAKASELAPSYQRLLHEVRA